MRDGETKREREGEKGRGKNKRNYNSFLSFCVLPNERVCGAESDATKNTEIVETFLLSVAINSKRRYTHTGAIGFI